MYVFNSLLIYVMQLIWKMGIKHGIISNEVGEKNISDDLRNGSAGFIASWSVKMLYGCSSPNDLL